MHVIIDHISSVSHPQFRSAKSYALRDAQLQAVKVFTHLAAFFLLFFGKKVEALFYQGYI
jgi:hypothetical protein